MSYVRFLSAILQCPTVGRVMQRVMPMLGTIVFRVIAGRVSLTTVFRASFHFSIFRFLVDVVVFTLLNA